MATIDVLYYKSIGLIDDSLSEDKQYTTLVSIFCNSEQKLARILSGEELELFNEIINATDEIRTVSSEVSFKIGLRIGLQIMSDCL